MAEVAFRYAWPEASLRGALFVFWQVTIGAGEAPVDLLLPYWATIRIPLGGTWFHGDSPDALEPVAEEPLFHGLTDRARWISGSGGSMFCAVLFPLFWTAFPRLRASDHANKVRPLEGLGGMDAGGLARAISAAPDFEARVTAANGWFAQSLASAPPPPPHVPALMGALNDPEVDSVGILCERLNLSQPQLSRLCERHYGFTPKLLIRRERFLRMLFTMERRPYAEWPQFIDAQYVDQSHMIRDFKDFTGLSPSQYFALERPILSVAAEAIKQFLSAEMEPASTAVRRIREDG